jgi:hypothetical protein
METAAVTSFIVSVLSHFSKLNFSIRSCFSFEPFFKAQLLNKKGRRSTAMFYSNPVAA